MVLAFLCLWYWRFELRDAAVKKHKSNLKLQTAEKKDSRLLVFGRFYWPNSMLIFLLLREWFAWVLVLRVRSQKGRTFSHFYLWNIEPFTLNFFRR
jgi:hypothetical protein